MGTSSQASIPDLVVINKNEGEEREGGAPRQRLSATPQKGGNVEVRRVEPLISRHFLDRRRATVLLVDLATGLGPGYEAGGDHCDLDLAGHLLVDDRSEDDVGVL